MDTLNRLDAFVLQRGHVTKGQRVLIGWAGYDFAGTCGARDTMTSLMEGGTVNEQELSILIATETFGEVEPPGKDRRDVITVCVDAHGLPCFPDNPQTATRVNARVVKVGRAGGGLTFTLRTEQRG
jgi:hypothetical protein